MGTWGHADYPTSRSLAAPLLTLAVDGSVTPPNELSSATRRQVRSGLAANPSLLGGGGKHEVEADDARHPVDEADHPLEELIARGSGGGRGADLRTHACSAGKSARHLAIRWRTGSTWGAAAALEQREAKARPIIPNFQNPAAARCRSTADAASSSWPGSTFLTSRRPLRRVALQGGAHEMLELEESGSCGLPSSSPTVLPGIRSLPGRTGV